MTEYELQEGFTLQHYRDDDWFAVMDGGWWVEHWLMCNEESRVDVRELDGGFPIRFAVGDYARRYYGDVGLRECFDELEKLDACSGPYHEGTAFDVFTGNHETALSNELLIIAGYVDLSGDVWWRARRNPLVAALVGRWLRDGGSIEDLTSHYVVGVGETDAYGRISTFMDVYVDPNMDDDYDVARWDVEGYSEVAQDSIDGPNSCYWRERLPMLDVSECEWDDERNVQTVDGARVFPWCVGGNADGFLMGDKLADFLMCGEGEVWHVRVDVETGHVEWGRVWFDVN